MFRTACRISSSSMDWANASIISFNPARAVCVGGGRGSSAQLGQRSGPAPEPVIVEGGGVWTSGRPRVFGRAADNPAPELAAELAAASLYRARECGQHARIEQYFYSQFIHVNFHVDFEYENFQSFSTAAAP